jgi:hypothetical protein
MGEESMQTSRSGGFRFINFSPEERDAARERETGRPASDWFVKREAVQDGAVGNCQNKAAGFRQAPLHFIEKKLVGLLRQQSACARPTATRHP